MNIQTPELPVDESLTLQKRIHIVMMASWIFLGVTFALSFGLAFARELIAHLLNTVFGASHLVWMIIIYTPAIFTILTTLLSSVMTLAYVKKQTGQSTLEPLKKTRFQFKWVIYGISNGALVSILLNFVLMFFQWLTHIEIPETSMELPPNNPLVVFLVFVAVVIVAPICEELVYRGTLCRLLAKTNKGFAVIFSALLFGLAHMNFDQGLPVFGLGIVFGYMYIRSGSIWVPILCHMFNNLYAFLVTLVLSYGWWGVANLLSTGFLLLAVAGALVMVLQGRELQAMSRLCFRAREQWKTVSQSVSFWLMVVIFLVYSILLVVMS